MTRVIVAAREVGALKIDWQMEFDLPEVPKPGHYISVLRPELPEPYSDDLIVEKVWWRLKQETGVVGSVKEIFVECIPAIGPWSSDRWRDALEFQHKRHGTAVPRFEIARLEIRQDDVKKPK